MSCVWWYLIRKWIATHCHREGERMWVQKEFQEIMWKFKINKVKAKNQRETTTQQAETAARQRRFVARHKKNIAYDNTENSNNNKINDKQGNPRVFVVVVAFVASWFWFWGLLIFLCFFFFEFKARTTTNVLGWVSSSSLHSVCMRERDRASAREDQRGDSVSEWVWISLCLCVWEEHVSCCVRSISRCSNKEHIGLELNTWHAQSLSLPLTHSILFSLALYLHIT